MKSIFGFLTGAAIGAGGLFGLRKILRTLEGPETAVVEAPTPTPAPATGNQENPDPSPVSKVKVEEGLDVAPVEETNPAKESATLPETVSQEAPTGEAESIPETPVSLVGEPVARHEEPIAAIESDPEVTTPRSESAEPAVPEEVVVKPVASGSTKAKETGTAKPVTSNNKNGKGGKKNSRSNNSDDFTTILDIGPVFNQKLHAAGIKSFRDLAKLSPAQVEEKTGIPAERVVNGKWIEQVQKILADIIKE